MTDRELLELAAKAAGMTEFSTASFWSKGYRVRDGSGDGWYPWNPLNDDGDAFRLSVHLGLVPQPYCGAVYVSHAGDWTCEPIGNDRLTATRRAIVRAAAEIGKCLSNSSHSKS